MECTFNCAEGANSSLSVNRGMFEVTILVFCKIVVSSVKKNKVHFPVAQDFFKYGQFNYLFDTQPYVSPDRL